MEEVQEHDHKHKKAKRSVSQMVSATIDGQVVSWMNVYAGPGVSTGLPAPVAAQEYDVNESTPDATAYDSYVQVVTVLTTETLSGAPGSTTAVSDVVASELGCFERGAFKRSGFERRGFECGGIYCCSEFNGFGICKQWELDASGLLQCRRWHGARHHIPQSLRWCE